MKMIKKIKYRMGLFQEKKQIKFGKIIYFPDSLEIIRDNQSCTLTPIPARILDLLISRAGQYVSRQEIIENAWIPARTVTEENFYQTIKRLRQLLGDTTKPPKYIINSHTHHYTIKSPVSIKESFKPLSVIYKRLFAVGFFMVCAFMIGFNMSGISYQQGEYSAVTTLKGQIRLAVISPDQSNLVFEHKAPGEWWNLKAKSLNTEKYVELVIGKKGVYNTEPDFSPSGKRLSWITTDYRSMCKVMVADFDPLAMSLSNQEPLVDCVGPYYGRSPKWKTENSLLVALSQGKTKPNAVFEIDLITRNKMKVTSPIGTGYGDYALFYNPNNNMIAHLRQLDAYDAEAVLMVYDVKLKTDIIIKKYSSPQYSVAWIDETRLLVKGDNGFEVVSLDGQSAAVYTDQIEEQNYIFSMGDSRFGIVRGSLYSADINMIDLVNHTQSTTKFSSASHDRRVVIAKETGEIAFSSKRNGYRQIFITVDQVPVQVTHFTTPVLFFDLAISPYDRYVAFQGGGYLYVLDNAGSLIYKSKIAVSGISFSADGKSLLFGSETAKGIKIIQLSLSNLSESIITDGFMPKAVEDGAYFFRTNKETEQPVLHKITEQGEVIEFFEAPFHLVDSTSFDVIGDQLLYVRNDKDQKTLVSHHLFTNEIKVISPLKTTKFSINKNMTMLVTNPKGEVQNNLAAFKLLD